jgi:metal-dependent amidase/aminoacylase/carboxypeptidase family protein
MCLMFHVLDLSPKVALLWPRSNAFISKQVKFIGKSAHAGSAPELGVNALQAANLAIMNINAQRDTFRDTDHVRVHYIITKGGDIVNVVPADVRMEITVRANNLPALENAEMKVDRSLRAGAMALGAQVEIENIPGYLPILEERTLKDLCKDNLKLLGYQEEIQDSGDFGGSFDFGDLTHLMPGLHPLFGGVSGSLHTAGFRMTDEGKAVLLPAKTLATMVVDLLADHAVKAKEIIASHKPAMRKEEYLKYLGV